MTGRAHSERRFPRSPRAIARAGAALLSALFVLGAGHAEGIERGTRGFGLSVFEGTEPERFEVEFLGAVRGAGGTGTLLLARLSGPRVDSTGVQQGMSGSPVYVDDRLVGAVASTWAFASEPIAGIRPIEEMRALSGAVRAGAVSPTLPYEARRGEAATELRAAGPVWGAGGFGPATASAIESALGAELRASAASGASPAAERPVGPGDAVAVLLVDGDARLFATGTLTEREGDLVTAFGHPFLGTGSVSLPLARAEVVTVLPSRQLSFKIASATEVVGALVYDQRAGVVGRLGERARTLPVRVSVRTDASPEGDDYEFEIGQVPGLTPQLAVWCAQNAVLDRQSLAEDRTARVEVRVELEDGRSVRTAAALAGPQLAEQLGAEVALALGLLEASEESTARARSVSVEVRLSDASRAARIERVVLGHREPSPGEEFDLRVEIVPWRSARRWVDLRLRLPEVLPAGRYLLHVMDGAEAFREEISRGLPRWTNIGPRQIDEALALRTPADHVVAVLYGPSQSTISRGVEYDRLPPRVRTVLGRGRHTDAAEPALVTPLVRVEAPTGFVLSGAVRTTLEVLAPAVDAPPADGRPGASPNGKGRK